MVYWYTTPFSQLAASAISALSYPPPPASIPQLRVKAPLTTGRQAVYYGKMENASSQELECMPKLNRPMDSPS